MERTFHMLLYRAFHAQRNFLRPSLGELGLGPGQPKLLNYLMNRGPCRQRELADYFEIDPAAVCRMLDCLQKSGFVTRRADGQSRRRDWQRRCRVMEEAMLSGFNPEERRQFADYLSRAYRNLRAEREEGTK